MTTHPDLNDVRGLALPRLALEVAAAGGHNLLLHGPCGAGKTMLARRIAGLLPALSEDALHEVNQVRASVTGMKPVEAPLVRMPHHTCSVTGLLGGGNPPRPGEVSLAHRGVLFLDELPEFSRACTEGLRWVLTERKATIVRARDVTEYPADFLLVAAMTRCPCGYLEHPDRVCTDSPAAVELYQSRVGARLLSYFDLAVAVDPLTRAALEEPSESSAPVRERIALARKRQAARSPELLVAVQPCTSAPVKLSTLQVARTLADLDASRPDDDPITAADLALAVSLWNPPTP